MRHGKRISEHDGVPGARGPADDSPPDPSASLQIIDFDRGSAEPRDSETRVASPAGGGTGEYRLVAVGMKHPLVINLEPVEVELIDVG